MSPHNRAKDITKISEYHIHAITSLAEEQSRVLKYADMFAVFNQDGNICPFGFESHGIYFEGTRFVSHFILHINDSAPLLLSSTVKEENELMVVDFTNPEIPMDDREFIAKEQVHILRSCFLRKQCYYERLTVTNYGLSTVKFSVSLEFEADFKDIFEIRGRHRHKRGTMLKPEIKNSSVELRYRGLDGIYRSTLLAFDPKPSKLGRQKADFHITLAPGQQKSYQIRILCSNGNAKVASDSYDTGLRKLFKDDQRLCHGQCTIETSNEQFNSWLRRSSADLCMMLTETPDGIYPYAGIPWFSTVFGRDGIITALETLWIYPRIARGVLQYLSTYQAHDFLPDADAEPGKILHEVRTGEMANLKEIPFARYYGSIDSTPLYLILAGQYFRRTGDIDFIRSIWNNLLSALSWIDLYGDRDHDGFVEYAQSAVGGLTQQGWKDSADSIFHKSGQLAEHPIALCEVQAYVYLAKLEMASIAHCMGQYEQSRELELSAKDLKEKFLAAFWCKDIKTLAIALDGSKRPCRVLSSNAGQCLFSGILPKGLAAQIRNQLMSERFLSGWGIRTIAAGETRYNPMSYHNGSVWPHDNSLIAHGLSLYGFKNSVLKIMTELFNACLFMDLRRLPELYCGFSRRPAEGPTLYPVACNPQSWASAAVFLLMQSCLGMHIDANKQQIYFTNPVLPDYLEQVRIRDIAVGSARLDINLEYHPNNVGVNVIRRRGDVQVISIK
jgi:glycogen debranching enzyme